MAPIGIVSSAPNARREHGLGRNSTDCRHLLNRTNGGVIPAISENDRNDPAFAILDRL